MSDFFCPGAGNIKGTPTLDVKKCPECGADIELFSTDVKQPCPHCGFTAYNDLISCIKWCAHARECVGDEMYDHLMGNDDDEGKTAE